MIGVRRQSTSAQIANFTRKRANIWATLHAPVQPISACSNLSTLLAPFALRRRIFFACLLLAHGYASLAHYMKRVFIQQPILARTLRRFYWLAMLAFKPPNFTSVRPLLPAL